MGLFRSTRPVFGALLERLPCRAAPGITGALLRRHRAPPILISPRQHVILDRIKRWAAPLIAKLAQDSLPVGDVHGVKLFEVVERSSCGGRVVPMTVHGRDELVLAGNILAANRNVLVGPRQMALKHVAVHWHTLGKYGRIKRWRITTN
jgi:hypothetical protein